MISWFGTAGTMMLYGTLRISSSSNLLEAIKSLTVLAQDNSIVAVIEMSQAKWLPPHLFRAPNAIPSRRSIPATSHHQSPGLHTQSVAARTFCRRI